MGFFDKGYDIPDATTGYMKFEQGENKFRILSEHPIVGFEFWTEEDGKRTPHRKKMNEPISPSELDDDSKPRHFWAMVVWNYEVERVQILQITQATIQRAIKAYIDNDKWGDPNDYDIVVNRSGEGIDTEYTVTVDPKEEVSKEIAEAFEMVKKIDLNKLYKNEDPFEGLYEDMPENQEVSVEDVESV